MNEESKYCWIDQFKVGYKLWKFLDLSCVLFFYAFLFPCALSFVVLCLYIKFLIYLTHLSRYLASFLTDWPTGMTVIADIT